MMKISELKLDRPARREARPGKLELPAATLEELLGSLAGRHPADAVALSGGGLSLSFAEVDALSSAIANFIAGMRYGDEAVVGVLCKRGSLFLAAALGVMRAGAVYLPVESELPRARQDVMLRPATLIIADRRCLREAEFFQYRHAGIKHVLCIDAEEFGECIEKGTGLASTSYWEHVAEEGSDKGWKSEFDGSPLPDQALAGMAAAVLGKGGLAESPRKRVLDIGSGSGVLARALANAACRYTAVELARNELDRVGHPASGAPVKAHHMEALDIGFLAGEEYDLIVMNGVVENFPGYNYLRAVLNHAVGLLADDGAMVVGAVRDLDAMEGLRAALREHALSTGNNSGLLRFDATAELFVPERFFLDWAAESPVPVTVSITRAASGCAELDDHRFDVVIRKSGQPVAPRALTRFGTRHLFALPKTPLPACRPEQAAYIVYTSGSTGVPKGVVVERRNLVHIIEALEAYSDGCERVALVAPLSFDASIQQLAVSLFCGKTLYVLSDEQRKSPAMFYESVVANKIDLCDMTPAFFNVLVEHLHERRLPLPIARILLAGEVLRPDVIQKFYDIPGNENVVLFNVYGPTECTVDSSAFRIDFGNHRAFSAYPVGMPLTGVVFSVRDKNGRALPDSVKGELWISGAGVSRGYLNDENPDAFVVAEGVRWYRTGDLGYTQNGLVFYSGREDQQVKIRGNRVEIGEVESAIVGFPGVKQAVVVADTYRTGEDKSLTAYVVGGVDAAALRGYLERLLPPYCVPGYIVPMQELPLTINRKVDRKSLPSPITLKNAAGGRRPAGPVEEKLAEIWKRLLGVDVADAEASFFSLGGHSILAVRLIAMIEKELNAHISISEFFTHPTIALLAELFAGKASVRESPVIKLCHCEGGKNLFLFHPVGGSVFCYSELASRLSRSFSVYAVEAAGFSRKRTALNTELHRVEDLAEYYLDEILKVETENIVFGGWSFGGLLAYETACRYEAMGKQTGTVLILDTVADNSKAKLLAAKDDIELLKSVMQDLLVFDEEKLRSLPRNEKLAHLVECGEKAGLLPFGFSAVQMDNLLQTYRGNAIAAARYEKPTLSDKEILFVRALDFSGNPQILADDAYQGWSRFLKEENITLKWTEGTHQSMLSSGLVGNVAKIILEHMGHE